MNVGEKSVVRFDHKTEQSKTCKRSTGSINAAGTKTILYGSSRAKTFFFSQFGRVFFPSLSPSQLATAGRKFDPIYDNLNDSPVKW